MSESGMRLEYRNADFCRRDPINYRLCTGAICVHVDTPCPCRHGAEYRCPDGQCILNSAYCDGIRDCSRGEDETTCPGRVVTSTEEGLPVHAIIAIVSVCLLICIVTLCVLGFFVLRRRKNNTSRESQSATRPLKTRYPSTVEDTSEKYDEAPKGPKRDYIYHQMYDTSGDFEYQRDRQMCSRQEEQPESLKAKDKKIVPSIYSLRNMKIYDFENETYDSFGGDEMGKYIFKPRLKNAHAQNSKTDNQTNENHKIVHSYRHAKSDQLALPMTFNIDLDPDNFRSAFATDLLCASTPRQPPRRLVLLESQQSLIDSVSSLPILIDGNVHNSEDDLSKCTAVNVDAKSSHGAIPKDKHGGITSTG